MYNYYDATNECHTNVLKIAGYFKGSNFASFSVWQAHTNQFIKSEKLMWHDNKI